jgi:hypothetical protein
LPSTFRKQHKTALPATEASGHYLTICHWLRG